jgi:hypothetical protein
MLFTPHSLAGAALGIAAGNPYAGFLLGVASHHLLDAMPHFDPGSFRVKRTLPNYMGPPAVPVPFIPTQRDWAIILSDLSIASAFFAYIFLSSPSLDWLSLLCGALGGVLPDIVDSNPLWSKQLRERSKMVARYHTLHAYFHWTVTMERILLGLATQAAVIFAASWYLIA